MSTTPYDFDRIHSRRHTASYKWDQLTTLFGSEEVLPLWVADMDFPCAPAIVEATVRRAQEGIYGYTIRTPQWEEAMRQWYVRRHGWTIARPAIVTSPSVVTSLALLIEQCTPMHGSVVLQSPVYHPFYEVIALHGRTLQKNPLRLVEDGDTIRYVMDLVHLETLLQGGARLVLLCNPHNPGGRVWTSAELTAFATLCAAYDALVISDEIHGDLVFSPQAYTPFAHVAPSVGCRYVSLVAATKTFNIPGVQSSFMVVPDASLRHALTQRMRAFSLHMQNFFAQAATIAAYEAGGSWLDAVLVYIATNIQEAIGYLRQHAPRVRPMAPEGTYLLWIDMRAYDFTTAQITQWMYRQAKVAFNEGSTFGEDGKGFVRINCACPRAVLMEALHRFVRALSAEGLPFA